MAKQPDPEKTSADSAISRMENACKTPLLFVTLSGLARQVGRDRDVIHRLMREGKLANDAMIDHLGEGEGFRLAPLFLLHRIDEVREILAAEQAAASEDSTK